MGKRWKQVIVVMGLVLVWHWLRPTVWGLPDLWPPIYWSLPIHARVVDSATGAPLEGVVVVAVWEVESGMESHPVGYVAVMETLTDRDGGFSFVWWRPRLRWPLNAAMLEEPMLLFFRKGYGPLDQRDDGMQPKVFPWSAWNGRTFRMEPAPRNGAAHADQLRRFDSALGRLEESRACVWKRMPRMFLAFDEEWRGLSATDRDAIPGYQMTVEERTNTSRECGSMASFLRHRP